MRNTSETLFFNDRYNEMIFHNDNIIIICWPEFLNIEFTLEMMRKKSLLSQAQGDVSCRILENSEDAHLE